MQSSGFLLRLDSFFGGLIQAATGSLGGWGQLRLNRLGCAAKAASKVFCTLPEQCLCLAVVDSRRSHVADARMAMAVVVPGEELLTVGARVFDAAKALREVGTVLERLELRLGERFCLATVSAINGSANCALSRGAIIQPTT